MNEKPQLSKIYAALFAGLLLIGLSPILIKLADAPGIMTTFYRMAIGGVALTPVFVIKYIKEKPIIPIRGIIWAVIGGVCMGIDMALWTTGIVGSNATLPTLSGNLAPLWVGLGAIFLFKEKHGIGFWSGVVITIIGVFLLIVKDFPGGGGDAATMKGVFLGLIAGVFYAAYQLATQAGRKKINTITYLYISTISTTVTAGILAVILGIEFTGYSSQTWGYWLAMGVGIQFGGWFLINYSQGTLPATVVAPTLLGQPIITAIIEVALLGHIFNTWQFIGGAVIIGGIYTVHYTRNKQY